MYATLHPIDGMPGPHDSRWVDGVLGLLRSKGVPAGALVAVPMGTGPGTVIALWDDDADYAATSGTAGPVTLGRGRRYEVDLHRAGVAAGPARYLQLLTFDGPRDEAWSAAFVRAGEERIWPMTKDADGIVEIVGGVAADGARVNVVAAESVEALESLATTVMSAPLLPGEDPARLTGPDSAAVLRLLHADLPAGAVR